MNHVPALPQLTAPNFISDGGLETTLVFHDEIDLPYFAAFPLLEDPSGRAALTRYYDHYLDIAERDSVGIVVDTPTWRANPDWGSRLGYDRDRLAALNRSSVDFVRALAVRRPGVSTVIDGVVGPRGDGYVVGEAMSTAEAASYHALQIRAFAEAGVDMVSAITMTHVEQAIGIAQAAVEVDVPVVISFTVETDGRLPSGQSLADAIIETDAATDAAPAYYMVNCAHPSHFQHVLTTGSPWLERIKGIRANASRMSHRELDEAAELDRGDPTQLADDYLALRSVLPDLRVVGGCCGTDHHHVSAISAALVGA